jgi:hypothetical protein
VGLQEEKTSLTLPVHSLHISSITYQLLGYANKLCRREAGIIHNHENENVHNIEKSEPQHRKYKRLKLGGCHLYDC